MKYICNKLIGYVYSVLDTPGKTGQENGERQFLRRKEKEKIFQAAKLMSIALQIKL